MTGRGRGRGMGGRSSVMVVLIHSRRSPSSSPSSSRFRILPNYRGRGRGRSRLTTSLIRRAIRRRGRWWRWRLPGIGRIPVVHKLCLCHRCTRMSIPRILKLGHRCIFGRRCFVFDGCHFMGFERGYQAGGHINNSGNDNMFDLI